MSQQLFSANSLLKRKSLGFQVEKKRGNLIKDPNIDELKEFYCKRDGLNKEDSSHIQKNTEAEFICEHYFGYTKYSANKTFEYEVKHPKWEQYEVINTKIEVDFRSNYGNDFAHLKDLKPTSVILAKGSEVSVENKRTIS